MLTLLVSFLLAAICNLLIIRHFHAAKSLVNDTVLGPQKVHLGMVPRIGGLGVFAGILGGGVELFVLHKSTEPGVVLLIVVVVLPAFLSGLAEDLTKRVPPWVRLLCAAASAAVGIFVLGSIIHRVDIPVLDKFLDVWWVAIAFTIFAVAGIAHATNIIDGFNGLSAGVSLLCLLALAYVAFKVNDLAVLHISLAGVGAVLGFLVWNYPAGLVFLGDGGAYMIGVVVAESAVLLVARNPQVSAWFPLLVLIYPIIETLFTIYRRTFVRHRMPDRPDALHLHSLIYRRLLSWMLASKLEARALVKRNSTTAPYLWGLTILCIIPAVLLYNHTHWLMVFVFLFVCTYVWLYTCIVKFKTPVWLRRLFSLKRRSDLSDQ